MGATASTFIGGGSSDRVLVAAKGSTMPTSLTSTPDAAFDNVGYLGDSGIEHNPNVSRKEFKAHQAGAIIRRKVTESGRTVNFVCLEHRLSVLKLVYPGTTWTDVTTYVKGVIPEGISTVEMAWIIDSYDTTNSLQKRWAFTGEATLNGSFKFGVEDITAYEFELAIYGSIDYYDNTAQLITDVV